MSATNTEPKPLHEWTDYTTVLAKAEKVLDMAPNMDDSQQRQELYRLLFSAMASGYHSAFADPSLPDFVPVVSNVLNTIGVNPDFIYGYTQLDGEGTYRISGTRGNEVFILIDFTAGGFGVLDQFGPSVGYIDIDKLTVDESGNFEVMLSTEKPEAYQGDWFKLDPSTKTASIRKAYYDWGQGEYARIAIERLDQAPQGKRLEGAEVSRRLNLLAEYLERYAMLVLGYGNRQREQGFVNKLEHDDWAGKGGVEGQHYYQGIFDLQPGEVMIVETELPEQVRYWNIQVNDALWNTINWLQHQSSINGSQAVIDTDGKFRAVISAEDPGVPNWLDTGGHSQGSLMLRWTEASSGPEPQVKIVPLAELREHLPSSTAKVSLDEREQSLRERRKAAQYRRRW